MPQSRKARYSSAKVQFPSSEKNLRHSSTNKKASNMKIFFLDRYKKTTFSCTCNTRITREENISIVSFITGAGYMQFLSKTAAKCSH